MPGAVPTDGVARPLPFPAAAHVWEWDLTEGGVSEMKYRFYATRDGIPLRLWMMGTNLYSGARR